MNNVTYLRPSASVSSSGSASGPEDPGMEERIAKLEQQFASIDKKLDQIAEVKLQLAEIKGQLSQMPKATEFGGLRADVAKLDGRVSNLPTMWQMILGFIGIILAVLWKTK